LSKFAHMSDIHLGAHREPALRELERKCFADAMDACISQGVDFVLISGDLFHVGIPDLGVVNDAVRKMREVHDARIPIYAIYGSHDYTPTGTSVIDILHTAGILTNIMRPTVVDGRLRLKVFVDPETGAKLTGIAARKVGLESKQYQMLDKEPLEKEAGFKVFAFHSGITQFKPAFLSEMETLDISISRASPGGSTTTPGVTSTSGENTTCPDTSGSSSQARSSPGTGRRTWRTRPGGRSAASMS
jgi:exonuclease SbcD